MKTSIKWHETAKELPEGFEPCYFTTIEEDLDDVRRLELHRGDYDPTWRRFRDKYDGEYGMNRVPYWTMNIPLPPCPPPEEGEDE